MGGVLTSLLPQANLAGKAAREMKCRFSYLECVVPASADEAKLRICTGSHLPCSEPFEASGNRVRETEAQKQEPQTVTAPSCWVPQIRPGPLCLRFPLSNQSSWSSSSCPSLEVQPGRLRGHRTSVLYNSAHGNATRQNPAFGGHF